MVVFAPADVQELVDLMMEGFDIADQYRNPVMIAGDGMIGQMMEPVEFKTPVKREIGEKDWATAGTKGKRRPNIINSLYIDPESLEAHNIQLQAKYKRMEETEVRVESSNLDEFKKINKDCKGILTVEMNSGQMIDDVKIAVEGKFPVSFYGRMGGMIPEPDAIIEEVKKIYGGEI